MTELPDGLRFPLNRNAFHMGQGEVQKYLDDLADKRSDSTYGNTTSKVVKIFQQCNSLDASGDVDEKTANAPKGTFDRMGAFSTKPPGLRYIVVAGHVTHEADKLYGGLQVTAFDVSDTLPNRLGTDKAGAACRYIIRCGHRLAGQEGSCGQPVAGLRHRPFQRIPIGSRHRAIAVLYRTSKSRRRERVGASPTWGTHPSSTESRPRTADSPRCKVRMRNAFSSPTSDSSMTATSCRRIGRRFALGRPQWGVTRDPKTRLKKAG